MFLTALVLLLVLAAVLIYLVLLADSAFGKYDFATNPQAIAKVIEIVNQRGLENGTIYDLGCARGNFVVKIARGLPKAKIIGIDDSRLRIFWAKTRAIFLPNVNFKKEDIFDADLSAADLVYIYLPQTMLPDLQVKLQKQMKKGSLVISSSVSFVNWQPIETYDLNSKAMHPQKLFIYQLQ